MDRRSRERQNNAQRVFRTFPEISIEGLDESCISRWPLVVLGFAVRVPCISRWPPNHLRYCCRSSYFEVETPESQMRASWVLPVEVRCYISCFRCLARNARCNTMSHLTADAAFSYASRAKTPDVTPCHTSLHIIHNVYIYIYTYTLYIYIYIYTYL